MTAFHVTEVCLSIAIFFLLQNFMNGKPSDKTEGLPFDDKIKIR